MSNNIAVFFGGQSAEYDVSLKSAAAVIQNIDNEKFNTIPIGITRSGDWFYYTGSPDKICNDEWLSPDCKKIIISANKTDSGLFVTQGDNLQKLPIDKAFPVLHGKNGEDGTIQGLLKLCGIPVIGCGILSSALCMDKYRSHLIIKSIGIKTPKSIIVDNCTDTTKIHNLIKELGDKIVVKPLKSGSSLGVSIIDDINNLAQAVKNSLEYDNTAIIEEFIEGNEVGCGVVGDKFPITGDIDEIELLDGNFDYSEKYNPSNSIIHLPARVDEQKKNEIKKNALKIYQALNCKGFARVDMFLTTTGEIIFNEVNTIPGFTPNSRFPKMMNSAGYSIKELLSLIIDVN